MKYVWASWGNTPRQMSVAERTNEVRTKHIRGYGCAVTFSGSGVLWSPAHATYTLGKKEFHSSISKG